jgi:uncharacterized protein YbcV (DUF1398 family)
MDKHKIEVMEECVTLSLQGKIAFPQVVRRLSEIGVERYHADYNRQEKTYYMPDGESLIVPMEHARMPIGESFSAETIEATLRRIQRGQINYVEFLRKTMEAGCVGYFVQITGRRALYFGRNGDVHVEPFPAAPKL